MMVAFEILETRMFQEVFVDERGCCHDVDSGGRCELLAHGYCHLNWGEGEEVGLSRVEE